MPGAIEVIESGYKLSCPLCETRDSMVHKELVVKCPSNQSPSSYLTHVWICDECPAVLFEYSVSEHIDSLKDYLERE